MIMTYKGVKIYRDYMGPYILWIGRAVDCDDETGNGFFVENTLENLQNAIDDWMDND